MSDLLKTTLSLQIYDILRQDIIQGRIAPGEKLTLKILQERFGVSTSPIREALTRLTADNLVTYYSNVGIRVVELTTKDLDEIYQLMGDLDALALRYACESDDYQTYLDELTDCIMDCRKALENGETERWIRCSDQVHLTAYRFCDNSRLIASAEQLRGQLTIMSANYQKDSTCQQQIQQEHENIWKLVEQRDIPGACQAMREHLLHSLELAHQVRRH